MQGSTAAQGTTRVMVVMETMVPLLIVIDNYHQGPCHRLQAVPSLGVNPQMQRKVTDMLVRIVITLKTTRSSLKDWVSMETNQLVKGIHALRRSGA